MLGSRFDLSETLSVIAERNGSSPEGMPAELGPVRDVDVHCDDLEREMVAVARSVHSSNTRVSFKCPVCDSVMQVSDESALTEFGALDVKLHRLECTNCGMLTGRVFHPSVGYHALVR